ncbi:MAG: hypothetical protein JXA07_14590 [Spirochaetes bacterium]|nr:hypothetical protein [Spirochaetota bacterium]
MRVLVALFAAYYLAAFGDVKITIPSGIALEEREVRTILPDRVTVCRYDGIEIVVYYYSSGIERLSYGANNEIQESAGDGKIEALIKLKQKGVLVRVIFITARGNGKEAILRNFSEAFAEKIPDR